MSTISSEADQDYEALIQFLYLAPVGLVQMSIDGELVLINPIAAQLLLPLSPDGNLSNLFVALESVAPDLAGLVAEFDRPFGTVFDALRIQLTANSRDVRLPHMLSLTILKLDAERCMAVLSDISKQVYRERLLRQSEAWLNSIVMESLDYALVKLDKRGNAVEWNEGIGRITGFAAHDVVGRSMSVFYPKGATTLALLGAQLREAARTGWSHDNGWRAKADGTCFWGSTLISPLSELSRSSDALVAEPDATHSWAYSLVIREIADKVQGSAQRNDSDMSDRLTGLANRQSFFEAAELEFAGADTGTLPPSLSVLLLQVSAVATVPSGDSLAPTDGSLRNLSNALLPLLSNSDFAARMGSRRLGVLMPGADTAQALNLCSKLEALLGSSQDDWAVTPDKAIRISLDIGIACTGPACSDLAILMQHAETALSSARGEGSCLVAYRAF